MTSPEKKLENNTNGASPSVDVTPGKTNEAELVQKIGVAAKLESDKVEQANWKFISEEEIQAADSFRALAEALDRSPEGMFGSIPKYDGDSKRKPDIPEHLPSKKLVTKMESLIGHIDTLTSLQPDNVQYMKLFQPASDLELNSIFNFPVEKGFRKKIMQLYDEYRLHLIQEKGLKEPIKKEVGKKTGLAAMKEAAAQGKAGLPKFPPRNALAPAPTPKNGTQKIETAPVAIDTPKIEDSSVAPKASEEKEVVVSPKKESKINEKLISAEEAATNNKERAFELKGASKGPVISPDRKALAVKKAAQVLKTKEEVTQQEEKSAVDRYLETSSQYVGALRKQNAEVDAKSKTFRGMIGRMFGRDVSVDPETQEQLLRLKYRTEATLNSLIRETEAKAKILTNDPVEVEKIVNKLKAKIAQQEKDLLKKENVSLIEISDIEDKLYKDARLPASLEEARAAFEKHQQEEIEKKRQDLLVKKQDLAAGVMMPAHTHIVSTPKNNNTGEKNPVLEEKKEAANVEADPLNPKETEAPASPEKIASALILLQKMKKKAAATMIQAEVLGKQSKVNVEKCIRNVGTFYKKRTLKEKLALSAILVGLAAGGAALTGVTGAAMVTAAFTGKALMRFAGASATFVTIEGALKERAEALEKGESRKGNIRNWMARNKEGVALTGALSVLFLGKAFGEAAKHVSENFQVPHLKDIFHSNTEVSVSDSSIPEVETPKAFEPEIAPTEPSIPAVTPEVEAPTHIPAVPPTPPIETPTAPALPETPVETSTAMPGEPRLVPPTEGTPSETIPASKVIPQENIIKKQVIIQDALKRKGDNVWGSLKSNGVSERAIANYEKSHHHSINRMVRDGQKVTFEYDKDSDTLKSVKVEKGIPKAIAHHPEKNTSAHRPEKIKNPITRTPESKVGTKITSAETNRPPRAASTGKTSVGSRVIKGPLSAQQIESVDREQILPTKTTAETFASSGQEYKDSVDLMAGDKESIVLDNSTSGSKPELLSFKATNITDPTMRTEVKNFFGSINNKGWGKISQIEAGKALKAKSSDALVKLVGGISRQDAQSGKALLNSLFNESGIKPLRKESVFDYIARATKQISKIPQK